MGNVKDIKNAKEGAKKESFHRRDNKLSAEV